MRKAAATRTRVLMLAACAIPPWCVAMLLFTMYPHASLGRGLAYAAQYIAIMCIVTAFGELRHAPDARENQRDGAS